MTEKNYLILLFIFLIFVIIITIIEIYILYFNSDSVECNSFGFCKFTTIIKNSTCFENGKRINCSLIDDYAIT